MTMAARAPRAEGRGLDKRRAAVTHQDAQGRPRMVDVGAKAVTRRSATAQAMVRFPADVAATLRAAGMALRKGAIVDTAIVAGTLAVKRTHELIPFCHPLLIEHCEFVLHWDDANSLAIRCTVALAQKTGVEMEALTGATVAALTVYDMSKALSHEIVIADVRLLEKSGGKRTVRAGRAVG
jgi:cyclic pyranopterin phosphate synthase